jgi:hypothetical protein
MMKTEKIGYLEKLDQASFKGVGVPSMVDCSVPDPIRNSEELLLSNFVREGIIQGLSEKM